MAGVKSSPSGSGYSAARALRLKTRIPLALSQIRRLPTMLSRPAKIVLPIRRTSGISLSLPSMREPMTMSVWPPSASRQSCGSFSGG